MAAVDKFRADKGLNYQGNPAGLVDQRFIDALRAAYFAKRKALRQIAKSGDECRVDLGVSFH